MKGILVEMATVKFVALMLLALLAISMLETTQVGEQNHPSSSRYAVNPPSSAVDNYSRRLWFCSATLQVLAKDTQRRRGRKYYGPGSVKPQQCYGRCSTRCSQTQHHKPCMFFCQKCCKTCLCVPPGFYGNKAVCPCYNNWKTQEGRPKCP